MSDITKRWISLTAILLLALATTAVGVFQLTTDARLTGFILPLLFATIAALFGLRAAGWLGDRSSRK